MKRKADNNILLYSIGFKNRIASSVQRAGTAGWLYQSNVR